MSEKAPDRRIRRTRQLLREALVELILEKGYDAVTVQDLHCDALEMTPDPDSDS